MKELLLFNNSSYIINQTVFDEWDIKEFEGVTYLYPVKTTSEDIIEGFVFERDFIEKVLDLCNYIHKIPLEKSYVPPKLPMSMPEQITKESLHKLGFENIEDIAHEYIKDKQFEFYYNDIEKKEHINTAILDIFNDMGCIPLYSVYDNLIIYLSKITDDYVLMPLPQESFYIPYENIIPVGLLASTLYQLFCDFICLQEGFNKSYVTTVTTNLAYNKNAWTSSVIVENMFEALKLYLINDKLNRSPLIKICSYCGNSFLAKNSKAKRCSRKCTNRANVKNTYYRNKDKKKGT